jgi:ATP-dependent DNA helicase DinG
MTEPVVVHDVEALIHADCRRQIAAIIAGNNGREVFLVGKVDDRMRVAEVEAYAFGTDQAVPAIIHQAQFGDVVLHNHPSGDLEPSGADIAVASTLGDAGVGCYIVDNACERVRVIVRVFRPRTLEPLDVDDIARALGPKGILARSLDDYEHRPQQVEMARAIAHAFNKDRIAVIEAGTGVGKSMAYLLPAIRWALANRQRVVVSTNTINLQEQLVRKDIPLLQKHSGLKFNSVLVKGRNNYVCLRRVYFMRGEAAQPEFESFRSELHALVEWALATKDGSLADLAARPSDEAWDLIKAEAENCQRAQCPYYPRCFFYEARRAASRAQIIVCNHHILMADLVLRLETNNYTASAILPPFQRLVIDEAHNLEDTATGYLGIRLTRRGMRHLLGRIYASAPGRRATGVLALVLRKLVTCDQQVEAPALAKAVDFVQHTAIPLVNDVRHLVDRECATVFEGTLECLDRGPVKPGEEVTLRITPVVEAHSFYEMTLVESAHSLASAFGEVAKALDGLADLFEGLKNALREQAAWLRLEVQSYRDRALAVGADLAGFLTNRDGVCRWLELRQMKDDSVVRFCTAPLEVGPGLRKTLFERCSMVVLTSATLTVDRKFDYLLERLGLKTAPPNRRPPPPGVMNEDSLPEIQLGGTDEDGIETIEERLTTLGLDTPFDFDRQAFVAVPLDVSEPTDRQYEDDLESLVLEAVGITRGRAFVLFTSYQLLERLHDRLKARLEAIGCTPLKQGAVNRHLLLNRFRNERAAVLFATSSFWEGVDVKGEALVCLILTRLPFRVPTDPIIEARVERLKQQGRDAFEHYTVPQAVIKFKQGFGRLIRHREDRGAVLIFDRRVATKRYGQTFLRSLPTRTVRQMPRTEMFEAMRLFFR